MKAQGSRLCVDLLAVAGETVTTGEKPACQRLRVAKGSPQA